MPSLPLERPVPEQPGQLSAKKFERYAGPGRLGLQIGFFCFTSLLRTESEQGGYPAIPDQAWLRRYFR